MGPEKLVEAAGVVAQVYGWTIRALVAAALIFAATKLGILIPWDQILRLRAPRPPDLEAPHRPVIP